MCKNWTMSYPKQQQQKLLGVLLDNKLTFDKHINNLRAKASQKLNAICRMSSFMSTNKKRLVIKTFISYQLRHCPLLWMIHSRKLNTKIKRINERSLQVAYNDKKAIFKELIDKVKPVSLHTRNLEIPVSEMFQVKIGEFLFITHEIFQIGNSKTYNLIKSRGFKPRNLKTVYHGGETISVSGSKLQIILPD